MGRSFHCNPRDATKPAGDGTKTNLIKMRLWGVAVIAALWALNSAIYQLQVGKHLPRIPTPRGEKKKKSSSSTPRSISAQGDLHVKR